MPVEVLTKDEAERLIREVVGRLLEESGFSRKLSDLEASVIELKSTVSKPPLAPMPDSTPQALMADLGERAVLLDIDLEGKPITLKPKQWLRERDFRAIGEVVKRHGGAWSPEKRAFTLKKAAPE